MATATLHYVHDPLCGWCYAAQPLVRAVRERLADRIELRLHGGGLFAQVTEVDAALAARILEADQRIAETSGQLFGEAYRQGLLADHGTLLYSMPPIAALLAARAIAPEREYPLLQAIQRAHYQQGLRVIEDEMLTELAEEVGLEGAEFTRTLAAVTPQMMGAHLNVARALLQSVGSQGFPTFVLEQQGQRRRLPHEEHYRRPEAFVAALVAQLRSVH